MDPEMPVNESGNGPSLFYIPIIHDDKKCVATDNKLKIAALVMRCFADIFYITDIYYQIRNKSVMASPTRTLSPYFISTDFIGVIPLPQVLILFLYSKRRGPRTLDIRRLLDFLVFAQYVLRIVRTYLSTKELKRTPRAPDPLVNGLLNLFLYVTASHIGCWRRACRRHDGCDSATFDCNENTLANRTFLNDFCHVDPPNATVFDFGIFLDALQTDMLDPMDFPKKFFQCYWWGLRNLSSFGSNLDTSTFAWETWFAILVSVIGLLLFLYLIGNLQVCRKLINTGSRRKEHEMQLKMLSTRLWMKENNIPEDMKPTLLQHVRCRLEDNKDIDLRNMLSILPREGVVWSFTAYDDNGSNNVFRSFKRLEKGAYYGEEFLNWALTVSGFDSDSRFPMSSLNVRCHTKVEALVLTANDLMAFKRKQQWLLEWACLVLQNAWRRHKTKKKNQMRLLIH
ncbi:hypothetical protein FEM48_Zijuj03G0172700 [Ziziphus jujuba var. spinosa]|uniref:Cyclic nucleotide-gated ion channel 1-like n=1 Tax=Ziziphus jujuba var. spinosa TaxID=714518 RepID=A0A978VRL6_ZIZJJ|nr:hypothetical protein FEM48_Zijuj03G0172700 [Ziziphus jujuba var. spinosa]